MAPRPERHAPRARPRLAVARVDRPAHPADRADGLGPVPQVRAPRARGRARRARGAGAVATPLLPELRGQRRLDGRGRPVARHGARLHAAVADLDGLGRRLHGQGSSVRTAHRARRRPDGSRPVEPREAVPLDLTPGALGGQRLLGEARAVLARLRQDPAPLLRRQSAPEVPRGQRGADGAETAGDLEAGHPAILPGRASGRGCDRRRGCCPAPARRQDRARAAAPRRDPGRGRDRWVRKPAGPEPPPQGWPVRWQVPSSAGGRDARADWAACPRSCRRRLLSWAWTETVSR